VRIVHGDVARLRFFAIGVVPWVFNCSANFISCGREPLLPAKTIAALLFKHSSKD
jgi:hypothetical protein